MMDNQLADFCKTCNIYFEGELQQVQDAVDEHGLAIVRSAIKRQSITDRDKSKYPIEQFQDVLKGKLRKRI